MFIMLIYKSLFNISLPNYSSCYLNLIRLRLLIVVSNSYFQDNYFNTQEPEFHYKASKSKSRQNNDSHGGVTIDV